MSVPRVQPIRWCGKVIHLNLEDIKLPIKKSAYKELRKSKARHFKNISIKSEVKTLAKKFERLVSDKKIKEAKDFLTTLISKIDKAASKGMIHRNAASRKISRLTKKLAHLGKA